VFKVLLSDSGFLLTTVFRFQMTDRPSKFKVHILKGGTLFPAAGEVAEEPILLGDHNPILSHPGQTPLPSN
jgi:hypothetical protein